ncbi:GGDEF domain-containing protein [uncultured Rhodoferax sp.]|uniref:GGDEF domain-containing protein n=1 Tax=uncultured Rhodoferax sp. TaxID=223188 RepID=UPI002600ED14|nr:GGDEF domain-containing protein [uncultured Rhodoferax sp.]
MAPLVSTNASPPSIELQDLRLDDARALLDHGPELNLPSADASATAHLQAIIDGLCELSLKDPLTGLANRRHFKAVVDRAIDVVARSGEPALLLTLDIDYFKLVNDTHGHHAGDLVLQAIAKTLLGCVRPMDTVARLGGEEFAIMLPSCHTAYGTIVAERIRKTIESMDIQIAPGQSIRVTISVGGAFAPEWVRSTAALWSERADLQLYRAKAEGRNRVFLDQQQEVFVSAEEKSLLFGHLSLGEPAWIESATADSSDGNGKGAMQRVF